jgi:sulfur relay (sulfurtransferase) DsrF/TusC family protein
MIADLLLAKDLAEKLRDTLYRCRHCYTVSAVMAGRTLDSSDLIVGCEVCHNGPRERLVDWLQTLERA